MKWFMAIAAAVLVFLVATNPVTSALFGLLERGSVNTALGLDGVESCPEVTIRSHVEHPLLPGRPVRVPTTSDRWSEQVQAFTRPTIFRYDQSVGLCVLKEKPDGELVVEYRPPIYQRSSGWKPDVVKSRTVAFATPQGPMNVQVRLE